MRILLLQLTRKTSRVGKLQSSAAAQKLEEKRGESNDAGRQGGSGVHGRQEKQQRGPDVGKSMCRRNRRKGNYAFLSSLEKTWEANKSDKAVAGQTRLLR